MILQVLLMGAVRGFAVGFAASRFLEGARCKHVTSPAAVALCKTGVTKGRARHFITASWFTVFSFICFKDQLRFWEQVENKQEKCQNAKKKKKIFTVIISSLMLLLLRVLFALSSKNWA